MRASVLLKKASIFVLAGFLAACQTGQGPAPTPATSAAPAVQTAPLPAVAYAPETAVERGFSALVLNASTGEELYAVDADAPRYPASLSKMMTLYLLFDAVSQGRYTLSTPLSVSAKAAWRK